MTGSGWSDWENDATGRMPQQGGPGSHMFPEPGAEGYNPYSTYDQGAAAGYYGEGDGGRGQGLSGGMIAAIVAGAVVLLALIGGGAYLAVSGGLGGGSGSSAGPITSTVVVEPEPEVDEPTTPTTTERQRVTPSSSNIYQVCDSGSDEPFSAAAAGTRNTSCPFSVSVKEAYLAEVGDNAGESANIQAHSTVTGMDYSMTCSGGEYVTCRGGNNAVVHIY